MIVLENINKSFQQVKRIDSLSFHISKGEVVGYIGANGAGKTTSFRILTGTLLPDSGFLRVCGINPYKNKMENLKNIAVVDGIRSQLWKEMKLEYSFLLAKKMYGISNNDYNANMNYLCEKLDLEEILNCQVNKLSLGERMKAEIAYSLLHNPKILYLDEATIGLDLINKEKIINVINEINRDKETTILFSSNNLGDIEKTCKRIIVIDKGKKIYEGDISRLKRKYASNYLVKIKIEKGKIPDLQDVPIKKYKLQEDNLFCYYENNIINASDILNQVMKQCFIKDVKIIEPKLEDVIRNIYLNKG